MDETKEIEEQRNLQTGKVADILDACISHDNEAEWFEFKANLCKPDEIGEYISALSNAAALAGEPFGYVIWGIDDKTHKLIGTRFDYQKDVNNEPIQHYLSRQISPPIYFRFDEDSVDGRRFVLLTIPAARTIPTAFKDVRYIRIGSSKENIRKHPEREAELFRILNYGPATMQNTPSRFTELSFNQLFIYYETRGIRLREETFKENLELLTQDGRYNILAQLLSDDPHIDIQFALFNGKDKASSMYAVRNFGHMCILLSLDRVLDFGDTLNIPQADERNRKVERKEVMLFNTDAFREAVVNAFAHNDWLHENSPMFTAYEDRIEITSFGTLPPTQTREGFFGGRSVPVNRKLSEILVQLHISERSGRGVPKIVGAYGKDVFGFKDNAIVVSIPFDRLHLGNKTKVTPSETHTETHIETHTETHTETSSSSHLYALNDTMKRILEYCSSPRSGREILEHLGMKDKNNLMLQIKKLLDQGRLARTVPNNPKNRNQRYVTIR